MFILRFLYPGRTNFRAAIFLHHCPQFYVTSTDPAHAGHQLLTLAALIQPGLIDLGGNLQILVQVPDISVQICEIVIFSHFPQKAFPAVSKIFCTHSQSFCAYRVICTTLHAGISKERPISVSFTPSKSFAATASGSSKVFSAWILSVRICAFRSFPVYPVITASIG